LGRTGLVVSVLIVGAGRLWSQEGDRFVRRLDFTGNRAIADATLRAAIETSRATYFARSPIVRWLGLGSRREFDERTFRRDVLRLKALYGAYGYPNAQVDTVLRRTDAAVDIRFRINEGDPRRVASLVFTGAQQLGLDRALRLALPLRVGEPFNRLLLQTSVNVIRAIVRDAGHPFAQVSGTFRQLPDEQGVDVLFSVDAGRRATVELIQVAGSQRVSDRLVRRMMVVQRGQVFSDRALYDSQLELYRMNTFSFANVSVVDSLPSGPDDSLVTVRAQLVDGPLDHFRLGAGYGTLDCFRALASWTRYNFSGGARSLRLNARASQIGTGPPLSGGFAQSICRGLADEDTSRLKLNYNVSATFSEPFLRSRRASAALTVFAERHSEFQAYLREVVGGELSVTRRLNPDLPVTIGYGLSYGRTTADAVTVCAFLNVCRVEDIRVFRDARVRSALSLGVVHNRTNAVLNPTRGTYFTAELRWASPLIGSDSLIDFTKATVELASYHQLGRRGVFAWRVRVGSVLAPRLPSGARFVPPEDRFYLGGPNSVRGYAQNELGPVVRVLDSVVTREGPSNGGSGVVFDSIIRPSAEGGNQLLLASAELRIALSRDPERFVGALFVDAGQVVDRGEASVMALRITPGLGVRIASPIGPLRFDVAYNPYPPREGPLYGREDGTLVLLDENYRTESGFFGRLRAHFSIGQAF
jgi:outer membrane protein assembly factor BamA